MYKLPDRYDRTVYDQSFNECGFHITHATLDYDFNNHTHDFYELAIVISGTANHVVGEYTYPIKRGDIFVIKGDVAHGYTQVNNLELIEIMYFPNLFMAADMRLSGLPGFRSMFILEPEMRVHNHYPFTLTLKDNDFDYVIAISDFIIQEFNKKTQNYEIVVKLSVFALFAYLSVKCADSSEESHVTQILSNAISYMQENLAQQVKISDIASNLFISSRHLCRLFKQYFDSTPGDYLMNMRLKHALTLLSKSNMKVADVAILCGFTDSSYFARTFKKAYGITPKEAKLMELDKLLDMLKKLQ